MFTIVVISFKISIFALADTATYRDKSIENEL